jgi:hypothetical protein
MHEFQADRAADRKGRSNANATAREILKNPSLRHPDKSIGVESVWDDGAKRR